MDKGTLANHGNKMPMWMVIWFYATAIICTIDASFIVLRPHTLPGGSLHYLFFFYKYYIHTDQRYNDVSDSYVYTQSLMNYAEVLLNIVTLFYHYRKSNLTKPLAFTVSVMTFWKTVLYIAMFYELAGGKDYRIGNTLLEEMLLVLIPNGIWLLLPGMCIVKLWRDMLCNRTDEMVRLKVQ
ncbi:uncharacterized protein LOC127879452 isoform X2 [Dreissena polymorpha]|uniref:Uncharacterized protein n=1 Tax=Dreissena polymorpha TaxID=45954 RepID=A0A9D4KG98_DREPO|nr:uncharacterized protein LOC127879452 isoform X2 [Dreissena polymorpha]XP_052282258.1 uncharacterized protein LOC127879452 isoform X2 [Dreissena polymorpha]XP_052282259.1 uncharacterized protein LOC127879452 isoform X2 [Dreissena polymorpha]XP_052282260.1 uncharacterized protein LOC127879452 isoform X2 [Dreissena polymorpha]XP_052282261.1 uncharacterized protein LOC127879452 isoform X2 [Dreissena polymorpha]XP_052282262.1 uncharacterized protein LOC127879452 isoform X2 [Dreissena polymorpha]